MPSDSHEQIPPNSVEDTKDNGEFQPPLTPDEIKAGTKVVMTHAQRQAFLKNSRLGQVLDVAHLLPDRVEPKTVEAIYENGVLRPLQTLEGLPEHSNVKIEIEYHPIP